MLSISVKSDKFGYKQCLRRYVDIPKRIECQEAKLLDIEKTIMRLPINHIILVTALVVASTPWVES